MYTGRRLDGESGLYDYRARMVSPALGRFMQTDPVGYADGINWYAYCGNNPINWIDSLGFKTHVIFVGKDRGERLHGFTKRALSYQMERIKNSEGYNKSSDSTIVIGDDEDLTSSSMITALNENKEINEIIYIGHGGTQGLYLDDKGKGRETNILSDHYSGAGFQGERVSGLPTQNLEPGAKIYLYSCYAGRGDKNIAQNMANHFNAPVYANDLGVSFNYLFNRGEPRTSDDQKFTTGNGFKWYSPK